MAYLGSQVTVGTSAVNLIPQPGPGGRALNDPIFAVLTNQDATNSVWLGGPTVAASGPGVGYELKAGKSGTLTLVADDQIWAVSAGSVRVDIIASRQ